MIDRLPRRLHPQRRHLTFVVALLSATFVLTAVMALQARRSEVQLRRLTETQLTHAAARTAQAWADQLQQRAYNELVPLALPLATDPSLSTDRVLAAISAELVQGRFCQSCEQAVQTAGFFAIEGRNITRIGAPPADAVVRKVWEQIEQGNTARYHVAAGVGLYFITHNGAAHAVAAVTRFEAEQPTHAYGFALTEPTLRELLRQSFQHTPAPVLLSADVVKDSVFGINLNADGRLLLGPSLESGHIGEAALAGLGPVFGAVLQVGIRPDHAELLFAPPPATRSMLLLALLGLIGTLIVLAMVLVKKEAELVKLRADFISSVSHELRTPLAQIRLFTETLLLGRVRSDLDRRRSLEIIDQEARRLTNLIENVLTYSKSEGGRQPKLVPETTSFAAEVRQAVESFGPLSRLRDVEIRTELQDNIAAEVDRGALRQILVNLIDNALKYGPKGQRITVGVALFGDRARLWVDDEGPGVPAADRARVFESFVRLTREVEGRTGGSGIGLAVVRELARLHGGSAWVEAAPGGGARFLIEFPDAYLRTELSADNLSAAS